MLQKNGLQRIQKKCQWVSWEISCMIQKTTQKTTSCCATETHKRKKAGTEELEGQTT